MPFTTGEPIQPNCYTTSKKTSVAVTSISVLSIQQSSTTKIPIGHPTEIFNPEKHDVSWYGLIKCKVIPPTKLYHPVLPQRIKVVHEEKEGRKKKSIAYEKLVFTLCKACAETRNQNKCEHSDSERPFIGTWTTDEVNKALEKGYKVLRSYEVWNFDN